MQETPKMIPKPERQETAAPQRRTETNTARAELIRQLTVYEPYNEQEAADKSLILENLLCCEKIFSRENRQAHMTASAWVVNRERSRVLMAYHKIYQSWSWLGGHADGEADLLAVALREVSEESGLRPAHVRPAEPAGGIFSVEVLTVDGHEKRGAYVSSHLHLNVTYLLEADDTAPLHVCEAENSGVQWFTPDGALRASTEPWFVSRIYAKLNDRLAKI